MDNASNSIPVSNNNSPLFLVIAICVPELILSRLSNVSDNHPVPSLVITTV